jgi:hydroxymethylpyrimidine pyrophosphatase-like HAD family hydrolase
MPHQFLRLLRVSLAALLEADEPATAPSAGGRSATLESDMTIRLIAIDLDGTLLNSRNEISEENRQALASARQVGVEVAVVTGRRFHSALPLVQQLPFPLTVISSNGARIADIAGRVHHRNFLPQGTARHVVELAANYRPYAVAVFDCSDRGQVTMQVGASQEGPLAWYLRNNPDCLDLVPDLAAAIVADPIHITFGGPPRAIEPLEAELRGSAVAPFIHLSWTKYLTRNVSLLDVMNHGCSKGSALAFWASHRGIPPQQVMAIGDNYNDREMLDFAGCAVLMGNGSSGLDDGHWFTTLSNDEHGVAEAIRRFALNASDAELDIESEAFRGVP